MKNNYKKYYVDYIFVHNEKLKKIYDTFTRGKKIVIGSFQNNFCDLNVSIHDSGSEARSRYQGNSSETLREYMYYLIQQRA